MDLIDRGYLRKMFMYEPAYTMPDSSFNKVMQALDDIPQAEVEIAKTGRWTFSRYSLTDGLTKCSQCGTVFKGDLRKVRFCSECGSRNVPKVVVI